MFLVVKGLAYLLPCDGVLEQDQMCEVVKRAQRFDVRQLGQVVRCQDQGGQRRN